jgi:hypothetical protein
MQANTILGGFYEKPHHPSTDPGIGFLYGRTAKAVLEK